MIKTFCDELNVNVFDFDYFSVVDKERYNKINNMFDNLWNCSEPKRYEKIDLLFGISYGPWSIYFYRNSKGTVISQRYIAEENDEEEWKEVGEEEFNSFKNILNSYIK